MDWRRDVLPQIDVTNVMYGRMPPNLERYHEDALKEIAVCHDKLQCLFHWRSTNIHEGRTATGIRRVTHHQAFIWYIPITWKTGTFFCWSGDVPLDDFVQERWLRGVLLEVATFVEASDIRFDKTSTKLEESCDAFKGAWQHDCPRVFGIWPNFGGSGMSPAINVETKAQKELNTGELCSR